MDQKVTDCTEKAPAGQCNEQNWLERQILF